MAAWLFISPYFVINANFGESSLGLKTNYAGTAAVVILSLAGLAAGDFHRRDVTRVAATAYILALATAIYVGLQTSPQWGTSTGYILRALLYAFTGVSTAMYACFLFDETHFMRIYWILCRASFAVAIAAWVATEAFGFPVLTHTEYGYPRLKGLLVEPSAWAPVIASMILILASRGRWGYLALVLGGALLVNSPAVLLTCIVSIPAYYVVRSKWSGRRSIIVLALVVLLPVGFHGISRAKSDSLLASGSQLDVTVGRLLSGIENVRTDGAQGSNTRFESLQVAADELRQHDALYRGLGPGAADEYFPAKFGEKGVRTNSIVVEAMFNFGLYGALAVALLGGLTIVRCGRSPAAAVFIPFVIAAFVNSAGGANFYKFAILGAMLIGLGWRDGGVNLTASLQPATEPPPPGVGSKISQSTVWLTE